MHRLTEFSLRRPWLTLSILLAITVGLGLGVAKVKPAFGFRVLIGEEHPAIQALDSLVEEFAGGYPARIVWECGDDQPCQDVFDPRSLQMADDLGQKLMMSPAVAQVSSPSNALVLIPEADGFAVRRFVENGLVSEEVDTLRARVLDDPLWVGDLVSEDASVGAIVIQPVDSEPETDLVLTDTIEELLAEYRADGFTYYVIGDPPENVSGGRALSESSGSLIPLMMAVLAVVLYFLTRSWQQTLGALVSMGIGFVWTLGILGWLGWPQDGMLEVLPVVVVIVGICDAIHILACYRACTSSPEITKIEALRVAARETGPPCLITTLTTAVAFASFTASDIDAFVRFGIILPLGVVACLLLTFSLLPIVVLWLPDKKSGVEQNEPPAGVAMRAIIETSARRSKILLGGTIAGVLFFGFGWFSYLQADDDWLASLGESSSVAQAIRFVEANLGSSQTLEIDLELPPNTDLESPETLSRLDAFAQRLDSLPDLVDTESVVVLVKRLNRIMHQDDPAFETIGNTSAANAELLELIGFDAPEILGQWMSLDRSRLRVSSGAVELTQRQREALMNRIQELAEQTLPVSWGMTVTGAVAVQHDWLRDVQATQLRSFPIAFGIVFLLVSIFLRSWKLGLAAMVPTLLPVVVVLGAMGWLGMSLDVARAMIAAVVIGIGVDDAIHLLAHYKVRREEGDTPQAAMSAALQHTGRAIVTTSIALALGFLTLMMSAWQTVASFGFFVALSILGALVATLLVLPALVFAFAPKGVSEDESAAGAFQSLTPAPAAGPDGEE